MTVLLSSLLPHSFFFLSLLTSFVTLDCHGDVTRGFLGFFQVAVELFAFASCSIQWSEVKGAVEPITAAGSVRKPAQRVAGVGVIDF